MMADWDAPCSDGADQAGLGVSFQPGVDLLHSPEVGESGAVIEEGRSSAGKESKRAGEARVPDATEPALGDATAPTACWSVQHSPATASEPSPRLHHLHLRETLRCSSCIASTTSESLRHSGRPRFPRRHAMNKRRS